MKKLLYRSYWKTRYMKSISLWINELFSFKKCYCWDISWIFLRLSIRLLTIFRNFVHFTHIERNRINFNWIQFIFNERFVKINHNVWSKSEYHGFQIFREFFLLLLYAILQPPHTRQVDHKILRLVGKWKLKLFS